MLRLRKAKKYQKCFWFSISSINNLLNPNSKNVNCWFQLYYQAIKLCKKYFLQQRVEKLLRAETFRSSKKKLIFSFYKMIVVFNHSKPVVAVLNKQSASEIINKEKYFSAKNIFC